MLLLCLELLEQKLYLTLWRLSHAIMWLHLTCLLLSLILRYFPKIFTRQNLTRLASTFTPIHNKTNFANSHFNKFFQHIFNNIMSCLQNPCFNGTYSRRGNLLQHYISTCYKGICTIFNISKVKKRTSYSPNCTQESTRSHTRQYYYLIKNMSKSHHYHNCITLYKNHQQDKAPCEHASLLYTPIDRHKVSLSQRKIAEYPRRHYPTLHPVLYDM